MPLQATTPSKKGIGWNAYFVFFAMITSQWLIDLIATRSALFNFHQVITAFYPVYRIVYIANLISAVLNLLSLIVVFLYIYHVRWLKPVIWQWFFGLRIFFDICAHSYEKFYIKSLFMADPFIAIKFSLAVTVILLPSYVACFQYAFQQKKIFPEQIRLL
jgi:hypothetical protein